MSGLRIAAPLPFDVCGPLPTGVTVLEASAGTGKTFTIAALAARYVAEGTPLDQILLVTFTRMATGELRDRVRERLVHTEQGLARYRAGALPTDGDEVVALLVRGSDEEIRVRHQRLVRAIARFDAATIATTHGFCQEVLGGLGIVGDVETDMTFVEDPADVVQEVVDDLFVRRFHRHGDPQFTRAEALRIARIAVDNPAARIEPDGAPETSIAAMRVRFAHVVCEEFERRKRRMSLITYEDLLTRLKDTLDGPGGEAAAERLRARYRVVLVDEFQDTDPVQWDIMRLAFGGGGVALILIGDPKQAIYAFRGADVYAYLTARSGAGAEATLEVNWRSDQALIDAYDVMFGGATLGHEGIVYRRVRAAPVNQLPGLSGAPVGEAVRVRVVHRDEPSITRTRGGYAGTASVRSHIARDLAADLVGLLSSGAQVEIRASDAPSRREPIRPGHVAVLVRTHRNAALVREALDAAGIPAVINGAGSVFGTVPARDWLRLLEAIERPAASPRARSAALTPFLGWTAERVACAGEVEWEEIHRRLHRWARVLRTSGVAALMETITRAEGLPGRVLARVDGERSLTDLRHVGQLLHATATAEGMGGAALTAWLRQRIAAAARETGDEERTRRLESDAEAVQVLTIHRSKGLEFPIVYCPDLWEPGYIPRDAQPVFFHDPAQDYARTIDVGLDGPDWGRHVRHHEEEQRGEDLRLAYVALTRARHQAVVWWAGTYDSRHSALGRLLFARGEGGVVPPAGGATPRDDVAVGRFEELASEAAGCISVERSRLSGLPVSWSPMGVAASDLCAAAFDRGLDARWRRTSFSDISAGAYEASVGSEPEQEGVLEDEPPASAGALGDPPVAGSPLAAPVALAAMPVGLQVGTLVHRVLEAADFTAPDLESEVALRVAEGQGWRHVDLGDSRITAAGLTAALQTPLGPLLDGARLCDFARVDRLDELTFELPLVGGDEPTGRLTLATIAAVLREHLSADDPLHAYAVRLEDPALRPDVRGYLTGSIDLVLRVRGDGDGGATPRFAIADYKTNWLAPPGEELTAWHHRPSALTGEMRHRHYGLQALLYTVALHRYLRWRVPDYSAGRHIAGVLYLFLRGMTGADTPLVDAEPCGVFAWRPPGALVEALSDVFDSGETP